MKLRKIVAFMIFIALLCAGVLACILFFITNTGNKNSNLKYEPIKTLANDGYIKNKIELAATGSLATTSDVGTPGWIKVPSTQNLNKFTQISKNGITIYRINNAEILKTTTNLTDQRVTISKVIAKYPNTLIMHASGFNMENGKVAGFQINNGKLIQDWSAGGTLQYTFIINKNGTCRIYDSTTSARKIIENGGMQSYDFGTAIVRDGKVMPNDGSVNWKIHTYIANDKYNNIYAIISDTNFGYEKTMEAISTLKLENMLLLDSGGSSQLAVNNKVVVASQDNRAIPDYIVMK